jgi:hypothetical protein
MMTVFTHRVFSKTETSFNPNVNMIDYRRKGIMKNKNELFGKYEDENGETYYCPINDVADNHIVSEWEIDNCVEASTAGRYSGNLNVADRFAS